MSTSRTKGIYQTLLNPRMTNMQIIHIEVARRAGTLTTSTAETRSGEPQCH